jgi:FkbH-like protein
MTQELHSALKWLPSPPEDFAVRCRALDPGQPGFGEAAQFLASHALDENQLTKLAKALSRAHAAGASLLPLTPFRLGLVSNATTHLLVPALVASAARHGIALSCVEADYGQVVQAALDPGSTLNRAGCDAVLIAVDHRGLPLSAPLGDREGAERAVAESLDYITNVRRALEKNGTPVCLLQTVPRPVESSFGSLDYALPGTMRRMTEDFNRRLAESLAGSEHLLLDVANLAELVGLSDWHDATLWNLAKLPFASAFVPLYADHVGRLLAALRGKSKKCLILDLDNTVWGGVIGDDGLEGIVLGQGDATGEAHLQVQRTALMLRERGVVLAVSSKNDDAIARRAFREHPEMLLREQHLAVFQANWNDKASNIQAIADELSLGLDAMVFLDDNPAERNLVRQLLPQVAVPELPTDPALYARTLLAAGYFEAVAFSQEDRQRAEQYQANARRVALQKQAGDVDAYLESLEMLMTLKPFDEAGRARIAQLINKSNQFNLTTRRYTEADVARIERDPDAFTLQVRLKDALGDNGMISVLICRRSGDSWDIDTWLMSCRVLGRKVEAALLGELLREARARGIRKLLGSYLPTPKNELVRDHYRKLGFRQVQELADGGTRWELDVASGPSAAGLPFTIERLGLETPRAA